MNLLDQPEVSKKSESSQASNTQEEDYLPLPRIICRIPPMDAKPYATRSLEIAAWTGLKHLIGKIFSRKC
jgi:hypothetical protein